MSSILSFLFFKQKTAYAMRISDWSSDVVLFRSEVEDALAAENGMQAQHIEDSFDWAVTVLQSDQANAFCLPGGKMAVYTGLVPVAQNAHAMAIVMGHEITHALLRPGAQRMTAQKLAQPGQMSGAMMCVKSPRRHSSTYGATRM